MPRHVYRAGGSNEVTQLGMNYRKEKVCPICGKTFIPTTDWAFRVSKGSSVYYCSHACSRKAEKAKKKPEDNYNN